MAPTRPMPVVIVRQAVVRPAEALAVEEAPPAEAIAVAEDEDDVLPMLR